MRFIVHTQIQIDIFNTYTIKNTTYSTSHQLMTKICCTSGDLLMLVFKAPILITKGGHVCHSVPSRI